MDALKVRAYTFLFYCVLLDIRSASYTHRMKWWLPKSWGQVKKNMAEINNIANVFHNLPELLVNRPDDFDETGFWEYLHARLPDRYEIYHNAFVEKLGNQEKR